MDYNEEDNGVSGSIPEFGAIFMANVETKKECLKRKVFALPPSMAEFVKHIKAGMLLFLFEYKRRQLFGVYQASTDGAIDIVPHGFKYSGRHYPAQVCFTQLWDCEPLSEMEFRDAIRENYFSAKKFKFGLSEDQVHRLLYLFSSRKLMTKISCRPLSEANVAVACKDRRMLGDARLELSEREYMEPDENDEFSPAAFCDHHPNSFTRVKDDEGLVDDGVNTEGKVHFYSEEDFLAKRRRLGNADKLLTSDVGETRIYNHHTIGIFHVESPKDALDEVRRSANGRRLSPLERVNKNQVDNILNRSGYLVDPLDVRSNDNFTFMQRSRLFDEYKMRNGSGQEFASDRYAESLDTIKYPVQRDYGTHGTAKHMTYGDNNLNLRRQTREWVDDQECLMNRKLENRCHLDCDGSPISAFRPGRLSLYESEPDFGTCSLKGLSSEKNSHPLQYGHTNIHDRKYPIMERRVNENMADNNFCSTNLAKSAGYTGVERRVAVDGRIRNSKRADSEEDRRMRTNLVTSREYPSFSHKQNLSLLPDKLSPERGLNLPLSINDDAIVTSVVPYSPEHPHLSHGCFPAKQNSGLVQENNNRHCSPGDFYSRFKDRLPKDLLEPEKFSRPIGIAPEFGNEGFPNIIPGNQSSLLHESTRSFVNPDLPVHVDPNTSVPINYEGSLFPKFSPPHTDLVNIGGENGLLAYPSRSRNNHFSLPSQHEIRHVSLCEMDMLANKDLSCSEAKDYGLAISHSERDWTSNEGQYFRDSSKMNLKELKKIPEAPHTNSNVKRRSVFSRLTSKEESKLDKQNNGIDFSNPDGYMHATADEVMKLLQKNDNLSQRNLRQSRVGGQPTHGENAVQEKKSQCHIETNYSTHGENAVQEKKSECHIETNYSTVEVSRLNDASLAPADGIVDMPNETRLVNFKRRSDRKKFGVITDDPNPHNKITCANEEVKSSVKTTLKRRKLVRPSFSKPGSAATDAICRTGTSQIPAPILDKDDKQSCETIISCNEAEMPNDTSHSTECNNNEHQIREEQKDVVAHVFPSTSLELKGNDVDLQIGSSQVLKETTQPRSSEIQISAEVVIETTIPDLNLPGSCTEGSDLGVGCENNHAEVKHLKKKKIKKVIRRIPNRNTSSSQ